MLRIQARRKPEPHDGGNRQRPGAMCLETAQDLEALGLGRRVTRTMGRTWQQADAARAGAARRPIRDPPHQQSTPTSAGSRRASGASARRVGANRLKSAGSSRKEGTMAEKKSLSQRWEDYRASKATLFWSCVGISILTM